MHDETMRELIDGFFSVCGSLAKEELIRRKEQEHIEQRQEHELELARIRNNVREHQPEPDTQSSNPHDTGGVTAEAPEPEPDFGLDLAQEPSVESIEDAVEVGASVDEQLDLAADATTCGFCLDIIDTLKRADAETARVGLEDLVRYERLKERLVSEGADQERMESEMAALFDDMDVVPTLGV